MNPRLPYQEFETEVVTLTASLFPNYEPVDGHLDAIARCWSAGLEPDDVAVLVALSIEVKPNGKTN